MSKGKLKKRMYVCLYVEELANSKKDQKENSKEKMK
jgi:hypothetical protein